MTDKVDLMELKKACEQAETEKEMKDNLEKFTEELQKRQKEVISDTEFKIQGQKLIFCVLGDFSALEV